MIRTEDEMNRIGGESQSLLRFLSWNYLWPEGGWAGLGWAGLSAEVGSLLTSTSVAAVAP